MKERNPSRVNRLTVNSAFFNGYPSKALEFFTLRSSLNPAVQNLPPEYPPQSPGYR